MARLLVLVHLAACSDYQFHKRAEAEAGTQEDELLFDTAEADTGWGVVAPDPEPEEEPPADAPDEPVYLHTGETLYSWNPDTGILQIVGNFALVDGTPVDAITDIAIDSAGRFFGVSYDTLYGIDGYTAEVWAIADIETPLYGLTCTSDGRLVGGGDGIVEIDTVTGAFTSLVPEGRYQTSGDIVGLPDGLLYWAVRDGDDLVVVDPQSGVTVPRGEIGVSSIYGLGYASGSLYGFTEQGSAIEIDPTTGAVLATMSLPGAWWGATTNPVLW